MKFKINSILFLIDLFQGTSVRYCYHSLQKFLHLSREEVKNHQFAKLKSLITHCVKHVSYYRSIAEEKNFTADNFRSFGDMKKFPILDRLILQEKNELLISDLHKKQKLFSGSSSGTTGIPIRYYYDRAGLSAGVAAVYLCYNLLGWHPGDKTLHIWGNPTSVEHWNKLASQVKRKIKNQYNLPSTLFNDPDNYRGIADLVYKKRFKCIDGYTTAIFELADFIETQGLTKLKVQNVFTTAENLLEYQKERIERNLGPVSDLYGCGEINGIAIRVANEENYIIVDPHVYIETEEIGNGMKNILVTDLDNYAMPLIRYRVGDMISEVIEPESNTFPQFSHFREVYGRSSEVINLPGGKKILPVNIVGGTLFRKIGNIRKHKVIWDGLELIFLFEVSAEFKIENAERIIAAEFKNYGIQFKISLTDKIMPSENGKYIYFEIKNNSQ